ncbi:MAG TPA: transposase [Xanthobacteraceae bacterium]
MSHYRRASIEGGLFFFRITPADRSNDLLVRYIDRLRRIYRTIQKRHPFETVAICVLPDHLHALWRLPSGDANFPLHWSLIKSGFSRGLPGNEPRSQSKLTKRERGLWQRRIGNMRFATKPILCGTSITFTTIP